MGTSGVGNGGVKVVERESFCTYLVSFAVCGKPSLLPSIKISTLLTSDTITSTGSFTVLQEALVELYSISLLSLVEVIF